MGKEWGGEEGGGRRGGKVKGEDVLLLLYVLFFFFQAEDGIRDYKVTGVQTCALPISCFLYCPFLVAAAPRFLYCPFLVAAAPHFLYCSVFVAAAPLVFILPFSHCGSTDRKSVV